MQETTKILKEKASIPAARQIWREKAILATLDGGCRRGEGKRSEGEGINSKGECQELKLRA